MLLATTKAPDSSNIIKKALLWAMHYRWHGFFKPFRKKVMKKIYLILAIGAITFASCGNGNGDADKAITDSSAAVVHPPDNSAATNPSLGDTTYGNSDTTKMKKDSSRSNPR